MAKPVLAIIERRTAAGIFTTPAVGNTGRAGEFERAMPTIFGFHRPQPMLNQRVCRRAAVGCAARWERCEFVVWCFPGFVGARGGGGPFGTDIFAPPPTFSFISLKKRIKQKPTHGGGPCREGKTRGPSRRYVANH